MNSLRGRIVILCALIALFTATMCAISTTISVNSGIDFLDRRAAEAQFVDFEKKLLASLEQLGYEVDDYANWDDLYQQMPHPHDAWAAINLTPGKVSGSLTQFMILVTEAGVVGRYHNNDIRNAQPSPADPVSPELCVALVHDNPNGQGFTTGGGFPLMYAIAPIRPSTRTGPARGHLLAIAYLNKKIIERLSGDQWQGSLTSTVKKTTARPLTPLQLSQQNIDISNGKITATSHLTVPDGDITFSFTQDRSDGVFIKNNIIQAINITGLIISLITIIIGIALGWWWLQPISQLAHACTQHSGSPQDSLPEMHGLREAELLRLSFTELLARLHHEQERLAVALDQQMTTNAVHRRFLGQLAHEIGQPIRTLTQAIDQLHASGGRMDPAKAAQVRLVALRLEERLQDVLTLVDDEPSGLQTFKRVEARTYLEEIAELLQYRAEQHHMTIKVEAPREQIPVDPKLLSPVLINLAVNALQAGDHGTLHLSMTIDNEQKQSFWRIIDDGPGLPADFVARFRDACQRGEVLPGTPGFGLGLALALANVRLLGGRIELLSTGSTGTRIIVILPLDHAAGNRGREASEFFRKRDPHPPRA